jgi:hypothetical protein
MNPVIAEPSYSQNENLSKVNHPSIHDPVEEKCESSTISEGSSELEKEFKTLLNMYSIALGISHGCPLAKAHVELCWKDLQNFTNLHPEFKGRIIIEQPSTKEQPIKTPQLAATNCIVN